MNVNDYLNYEQIFGDFLNIPGATIRNDSLDKAADVLSSLVPSIDNISWYDILSSKIEDFKGAAQESNSNAARTVESVSTIDLALWQKIAGII